jgi:hypothetical protein
MAQALVKDFPQPFGSRIIGMIDHVGPASYTQVTTGSPPTGGDSVKASEFGMKYISAVFAGISDDGQYNVEASPTLTSGQEATSFQLIWMVAHTGAEVTGTTNLSGRSIRLFAIGR